MPLKAQITDIKTAARGAEIFEIIQLETVAQLFYFLLLLSSHCFRCRRRRASVLCCVSTAKHDGKDSARILIKMVRSDV
jgi:hypothetical protein